MVPVKELAVAELLAPLPPTALHALAERAERRAFSAGEVLFHEGDPGDELHVLREGEVEVIRPSMAPGVTLAVCRPGDVFGELAVLTGEPRSATLIAITAGSTVCVSQVAIDEVLAAHPGAMRDLLGALAQSLTRAKESIAGHARVLEQRVQERTAEVRATHLEVLRRLGEAVESRDDETGEHILRMSRMAATLAAFAGLGEEEREMILRAAPLHDIGKIGIPDRILRKPGRLTPEEREAMEIHTTIGARLLTGSRSPVVQLAESIARSHHERWDGGGYPDGLAGEAIPLAARICSIVDVYDALVSERPYKRPWSPGAALAEIEAGAGTQFDPRLTAIFVANADAIRSTAEPRPMADDEPMHAAVLRETAASARIV